VNAVSSGATNVGCLYTQTWTADYTDGCLNDALQASVTYNWIELDLNCHIEVDSSNDCSGPDVTLIAVPDAYCELSAGYTYEYVWHTGDTSQSITVGAGYYSVDIVVSDSNGVILSCVASCDYEVEEECGTSWAKSQDGSSLCFNELPCDNNIKRWGFTTAIIPGSDMSFDILEGAPGQCNQNGALGDLVGIATLTWNGTTPVIEIKTTDGEHYINKIHVWMGCTPLPMKKKGKITMCTAAPGQFAQYGGCSFTVNSDTIFNINGNSGNLCDVPVCAQLYLALHFETCDLLCEGESTEGSFDEPLVESDTMEDVKAIDFKAYPIPFKDIITIDYNFDFDTDVMIEIYDVSGSLIDKIDNNNYTKNIRVMKQINLSRNYGGMLFVKLTTSKGSVVKKLISLSKK